ncbi:hypothetical protein LAZ67_18001792 [Cordylochernes scorpioides]|uniref:Reverse transcriptase n=1 Tax=Cordylochernes scorpioides TaxID=51811 RepID=A0ABY6LG39_9ARAC|nr:hypothetical protein LAZ67_18001792 [Cordylochernes scorpioides]
MNRCFEALKKHQAIDVNYIDFLEVDKDVQVAGEQSIEEIVKEVMGKEDEEICSKLEVALKFQNSTWHISICGDISICSQWIDFKNLRYEYIVPSEHIVVGLLSGHTWTDNFAYKISIIDDPSFPYCDAGREETLSHIMLECSSLDALRFHLCSRIGSVGSRNSILNPRDILWTSTCKKSSAGGSRFTDIKGLTFIRRGLLIRENGNEQIDILHHWNKSFLGFLAGV